ncbi:MAG: DUF4123 domain-containing protein [Vicinamibacterales bacterium]
MGTILYALFDRALAQSDVSADSAVVLDDALGALLLQLGSAPVAGPGADAFNGVGPHAVLCESADDPADVASQFRRLLKVQTESGERLYFRYYDARVFSAFVPTCSQEQLAVVFAGVAAFYVLRADGGVDRFRRREDGGFERTAAG